MKVRRRGLPLALVSKYLHLLALFGASGTTPHTCPVSIVVNGTVCLVPSEHRDSPLVSFGRLSRRRFLYALLDLLGLTCSVLSKAVEGPFQHSYEVCRRQGALCLRYSVF